MCYFLFHVATDNFFLAFKWCVVNKLGFGVCDKCIHKDVTALSISMQGKGHASQHRQLLTLKRPNGRIIANKYLPSDGLAS